MMNSRLWPSRFFKNATAPNRVASTTFGTGRLRLALAGCLLLTASVAPLPAAETAPSIFRNTDLALHHPDEFAWRIFVEICQPASASGRTVVWETWADQELIYANPQQPPVWPGSTNTVKRLRPARQQAIRNPKGLTTAIPDDRIPDGAEEVRDNRPAFDYIVKNELWYQEGVLKKAAQPDGIQFPPDSVSIKARWKYIDEAQKPRFHWAEYESQGKKVIVGLIALHISSKVIPNWHWATFEQVDNPGLGDFIGLVDTYGLNPARVYPNPTPNQGYRPGELRDPLVALMKEKKLGTEWSFYRLKGAQIDFTDSTGRTTLLGNSITEEGFVASSSCITCHSRSSANLVSNDSGTKWGTLSVFNPSSQSFNGPVDPNWFWFPQATTDRVTRQDLQFYQLDFLWQLGFLPKPRNK